MFLDTTFCIDLMRERGAGSDGPATAKLRGLGETVLRLPLFVLCELQAGARLARDPARELRRVEYFTTATELVLPTSTFATAYGQAEAALRSAGLPIPTMDLLIGVMAMEHGLPLLTRDAEHFARIPGLVVETY